MRIKQTARKSTSATSYNASWETFHRRRVVLMTSSQANARENDRPSSTSPGPGELRERTDRALAATRVVYRTRTPMTARKSTGTHQPVVNRIMASRSGSKMVRKNPKDEVSPNTRLTRSSCRPDHKMDNADDDNDDDDTGPGPSRQSPPRTRRQTSEIKTEV